MSDSPSAIVQKCGVCSDCYNFLMSREPGARRANKENLRVLAYGLIAALISSYMMSTSAPPTPRRTLEKAPLKNAVNPSCW